MSVVYFKFASSNTYDSVPCEGLYLTVAELKKEILAAKKLGKKMNSDLRVINEQTKEEYENDDDMISRNASVIVSRVPPKQRMCKHEEFQALENVQLEAIKSFAKESSKHAFVKGSHIGIV